MENPPLWVWAIVVGLIIAGKFAYRWKTTKQLAKEMERRSSSKAMVDKKITITILKVYLTFELQYRISIVVINIVLIPLGITLK